MSRHLRFLIPLVVFGVLVAFLGKGLFLNPSLVPSPLIDKAAPVFELSRLDNAAGRFSSQDMLGKVWLLNVWASWCPPCQKALSEFNSIAKEFQDNQDIVFVALSVDYNRKEWENTVDKSGLDALRHGWFDLDNSLAFNRIIPDLLIIDRKGILLAEGSDLDIRAELKKALEEAK